MLDFRLLTPSQDDSCGPPGPVQHEGKRGLMELVSLFIGWHPDDVFLRQVSVDMAELLLVFGTIAISLAIMVVFGNWWSR